MPDIKIFPYRDGSADPYIVMEGSGTASGSGINMYVLSDGTLSFEGNQGQVFSIDHNLSSGIIWSVNDIAGFPIMEADASGNISLVEFGGNVGIGTGITTSYTLDVNGSGNFAQGVTVSSGVILQSGIPSSTTNTLYNNSGTLYFNGAEVGGDPTNLRPYVEITGSYTIPSSGYGVFISASGDCLITLPTVILGRTVNIIRTDSEAHTVTVTGVAGELIQGNASSILNTGGSVDLVSDGTNWYIK